MAKYKIVIFGAGGLGFEVLDLVNVINKKKKVYDFLGFCDPYKSTLINKEKNYKNISDIPFRSFYAVCAVMDPKKKEKIFKDLKKKKIKIISLIHPDVDIKNSKISHGTIIFKNVNLSYDIKLNIGTLICYGSQIGHGVEIGRYCSLMPNVIINGNSKIGNKVKFGTSAITNNNITIGDNCVIGISTTILSNIKKNYSVNNFQRLVKIKNGK